MLDTVEGTCHGQGTRSLRLRRGRRGRTGSRHGRRRGGGGRRLGGSYTGSNGSICSDQHHGTLRGPPQGHVYPQEIASPNKALLRETNGK